MKLLGNSTQDSTLVEALADETQHQLVTHRMVIVQFQYDIAMYTYSWSYCKSRFFSQKRNGITLQSKQMIVLGSIIEKSSAGFKTSK